MRLRQLYLMGAASSPERAVAVTANDANATGANPLEVQCCIRLGFTTESIVTFILGISPASRSETFLRQNIAAYLYNLPSLEEAPPR